MEQAMKVLKVDHIGIAVRNLEESAAKWQALLGISPRRVEELPERGVKVVHLELEDGPSLELLSPLGEKSPLTKFLQERGEGIHHFCLRVKGIARIMEGWKNQGLEFTTDRAQKGSKASLVAFIHPRSLNGVLLELREEARD
jgi:methylmalonyl-CoA/ethylmalonyl-CoA epimerase